MAIPIRDAAGGVIAWELEHTAQQVDDAIEGLEDKANQTDLVTETEARTAAYNELKSDITITNDYIGEIIKPSKNILWLPEMVANVVGITAVIKSDNSITYNGTATETGGRFVKLSTDFLLKAGTYTLSDADESGNLFRLLYINNSETNEAIAYINNVRYVTFTLAEDTTCYVSQIFTNGTSLTNKKIFVQLEKGATATNFVRPLVGYDEYAETEIHSIKKNTELITVYSANGYMTLDGVIQTQISSYHCKYTDPISCDAGDIFHYAGHGAYDGKSYVIYDENGNVTSYGIINNDTDFIIPDNVDAYQIKFASYEAIANPVTLVITRITPITLVDIATGNTNALTGKTAVFDGDSICEGVQSAMGEYGNGWPGRISVYNKMACINTGVSGGTITAETYYADETPRHWVCRNIDTIHTTYPDAEYVIAEGGVNDADLFENDPSKLGTLDEHDYTGPFDDTTFYGAMDSLCKKMLTYYPKAKTGFIIVHKMGAGWNARIANRYAYMGYAKAVCKKWGVPVINLWDDGQLRPDILTMYNPEYNTITSATEHGLTYYDGQHLTAYGYDVLSPKISEWMKSL